MSSSATSGRVAIAGSVPASLHADVPHLPSCGARTRRGAARNGAFRRSTEVTHGHWRSTEKQPLTWHNRRSEAGDDAGNRTWSYRIRWLCSVRSGPGQGICASALMLPRAAPLAPRWPHAGPTEMPCAGGEPPRSTRPAMRLSGSRRLVHMHQTTRSSAGVTTRAMNTTITTLENGTHWASPATGRLPTTMAPSVASPWPFVASGYCNSPRASLAAPVTTEIPRRRPRNRVPAPPERDEGAPWSGRPRCWVSARG
jgi:hypothetical protein